MHRGLRNQIPILKNCVRFCVDSKSGIITVGSTCIRHQDYMGLDKGRQDWRTNALRSTKNGRYASGGIVIGKRRGAKTINYQVLKIYRCCHHHNLQDYHDTQQKKAYLLVTDLTRGMRKCHEITKKGRDMSIIVIIIEKKK